MKTINEAMNNLRTKTKIPEVIYHYTTIRKYNKIKEDNMIKVNGENLICCTSKDNFINFNTNPNIVRIQIDTKKLSKDLTIKKRDETDPNYVEFENEWDIDFSNSKEKGLKLNQDGVKVDFSLALNNSNEISYILRKSLK